MVITILYDTNYFTTNYEVTRTTESLPEMYNRQQPLKLFLLITEVFALDSGVFFVRIRTPIVFSSQTNTEGKNNQTWLVSFCWRLSGLEVVELFS